MSVANFFNPFFRFFYKKLISFLIFIAKLQNVKKKKQKKMATTPIDNKSIDNMREFALMALSRTKVTKRTSMESSSLIALAEVCHNISVRRQNIEGVKKQRRIVIDIDDDDDDDVCHTVTASKTPQETPKKCTCVNCQKSGGQNCCLCGAGTTKARGIARALFHLENETSCMRELWASATAADKTNSIIELFDIDDWSCMYEPIFKLYIEKLIQEQLITVNIFTFLDFAVKKKKHISMAMFVFFLAKGFVLNVDMLHLLEFVSQMKLVNPEDVMTFLKLINWRKLLDRESPENIRNLIVSLGGHTAFREEAVVFALFSAVEGHPRRQDCLAMTFQCPEIRQIVDFVNIVVVNKWQFSLANINIALGSGFRLDKLTCSNVIDYLFNEKGEVIEKDGAVIFEFLSKTGLLDMLNNNAQDDAAAGVAACAAKLEKIKNCEMVFTDIVLQLSENHPARSACEKIALRYFAAMHECSFARLSTTSLGLNLLETALDWKDAQLLASINWRNVKWVIENMKKAESKMIPLHKIMICNENGGVLMNLPEITMALEKSTFKPREIVSLISGVHLNL